MLRMIAAILLALVVQSALAVTDQGRTVIIIGVDGLSPRGVDEGLTPHMNRLLNEGSYTFHARGVFPTSSSPNWASMIMGAGPEQHGVTSNDWRLWNRSIMPTKEGSPGRFPCLFFETRRQRPDARIAVVYDWGGFGELFDHAEVDLHADTEGPEDTMSTAVREFNEHRPALLFVHLDHVDGAGHGQGWHTPEYFAAVKRADDRIGDMLGAIDAADAWGSTVVIVTSDHGGLGRSHGGTTMAELEIPWIIAGAGIPPGRVITRDVNTYDTACTAAFLLGLTQNPSWIGRPVTEALVSHTAADGWAVSRYLPAPRLSVPGSLIVGDRLQVTIECEAGDARITYTLDGSEATPASTPYRGPITIMNSTTLRARAFLVIEPAAKRRIITACCGPIRRARSGTSTSKRRTNPAGPCCPPSPHSPPSGPARPPRSGWLPSNAGKTSSPSASAPSSASTRAAPIHSISTPTTARVCGSAAAASSTTTAPTVPSRSPARST